MDRDLVSVVIRFGLADTEPSTWEGTYRLTEGRIVATDGWRFVGDDYATVSKFKFDVASLLSAVLEPAAAAIRKNLSIEPNGVVLTLAGLSPSSVLEVSTSRGDFTVPVGKLGYGMPRRALDGKVDYQRVPDLAADRQVADRRRLPGRRCGPERPALRGLHRLHARRGFRKASAHGQAARRISRSWPSRPAATS